jgi:hypothetical protein
VTGKAGGLQAHNLRMLFVAKISTTDRRDVVVKHYWIEQELKRLPC